MKVLTVNTQNKINELLEVLDTDIEQMEQNLSRLDQLRGFIVKRSDTELGALLQNIRTETGANSNHRLKRELLRKQLAADIGCSPEQVTLSRLEAETALPEDERVRISRKKEKLRNLTYELRKQYSATAMLLTDCARFNSLILSSIFNLGSNGSVTYDSSGATKRQTDNAFVSFRL